MPERELKLASGPGFRLPDLTGVVPAPAPGDGVGAIVGAALAASVARLVTHEAGVRSGDDPEAVHQARVATRRLRSDLRTFAALVDPEWADGLRDELRWLAVRLGAVRDADVLLDRLREKVARLRAGDRQIASRLLDRLEWDHERAGAELMVALRSPRYLELLDRLADAAGAPRLVPAADAAPAHELLAHLAAAPWQRVAAAVDALSDDPSDAALHDVRKRAKRARYAAEAVAPVAGKPAKRLARALAAVQDVLGEHQDAAVAEGWLRDARAAASPAEAFVVGQLAAMERAAADAARAAWGPTWKVAAKAAGRKQLRTWL